MPVDELRGDGSVAAVSGMHRTSAVAHAAAIEPAARAALPAALAAAADAGAASRGLHTGYTERAETMHERPKDRSERWKWTPEDGQGWDGGGGCGRAPEGGVEARRISSRPRSRERKAGFERAAYLRRGPEGQTDEPEAAGRAQD